MGLLQRILGRFEMRGATDSSAFFPGPTAAGQAVNARVVENLATVLACVNAISSAAASLPAYVYRRAGRGRVEVPDHPVSRLLRAPNPAQTWPDWLEMTLSQCLLHGNSLSMIEYDGAGRPKALVPIPWPNVQPIMLPNGSLAYDVTRFTSMWGGTGLPKRLLAGDVFHLRDRSDDGLLGRSRLSRAPEVLGNALGLQEYTGATWRNSATPKGALLYSRSLTTETYQQMVQKLREAWQGVNNAGRLLVLDSDMKFQPFSISPEDAEVLASRRFSVEELCRLYQVPPPLVQDYTNNTFTNAAQASLWFSQFSLGPWVRKVEAEFSRSVFTDPSMHLEIDLAGLMRGDYESRWKAHAIAVQNNILDVAEIREVEGWGPRATTEANVA